MPNIRVLFKVSDEKIAHSLKNFAASYLGVHQNVCCHSPNICFFDPELRRKLWSGYRWRQETLTTRTLVYSGSISCVRYRVTFR